MNKSKINYCDRVWNVTGGCTHCSPGCDNCWAAQLTDTRFKDKPRYAGLTKEGKWTGKIKLFEDRLEQPLHIKKPQVIFVNSQSDLFHPDVPFEFIQSVLGIIASCPEHYFLLLTKRPEKMAELSGAYPDNCYPGLTICNQREADEKLPVFLQIPGHKWLSIEPLLSEINLTSWFNGDMLKIKKEQSNERKRIDVLESGGTGGVRGRYSGVRMAAEGLEGGEPQRHSSGIDNTKKTETGRTVEFARLPKNYVHGKSKEICDLCSQGSMVNNKETADTPRVGDKSYKRQNDGQQTEQFRSGNKPTKLRTRCQSIEGNGQERTTRREKRDGKSDSEGSAGNTGIVATKVNEPNSPCGKIPNCSNNHISYHQQAFLEKHLISQVIVGAESGTGARPMNPDWPRSIRYQCAEAGVPFFFKQWGKKNAGRLLDGVEHNELIWRA